MAKKSLIDSIEVKTPCSEEWNEMRGNREIRFCSHCAKNVHNLSEMTHFQARKLVAQSNGNLCVRYIKRPDGTLQTADRPFYQIAGRATRIAAGAFGAALLLAAPVYAQGEPIMPKHKQTAARKSAENKMDAATATISGTVLDANGAVIPGAHILLTDTKSGRTYTTQSNDEGIYEFANLAASIYQIEGDSPGFKKLTVTEIEIKDSQRFETNLNFEVDSETELTGVVAVAESEVELMQAALTNDKVQMHKLIALGKDVNEKDGTFLNKSILHIAAESGDEEMTRAILNAKADVDITDESGETPLMIAAQNNHLQIVRLLLKAGANVHLQDKAGKTAMRKTTAPEIKRLLRQNGALE